MKRKIIITGGSGLVGQILLRGLRQKGYHVEVFDRYRGWLVNVLRAKYFATSRSTRTLDFAFRLNSVLSELEKKLIDARLIKPSADDILDARLNLAERFRGTDTVIHLAALAHADIPGFDEGDYRRINYEGAINVFEAAKQAGVPKFVFSSSVAVYGSNYLQGMKIARFPILETNRCAVSEGENIYGVLKNQFEDYLEAHATHKTNAVALRLDAPGHRVPYPEGFIVSTSFENLIEGFECALRSEWTFDFEAFNLVDKEIESHSNIDVQAVIKKHWPEVPNFTSGNMVPFSTEKLSSILGYKPIRDGKYIDDQILYGDPAWIKQTRRAKRELAKLTSPEDRLILVDECAWGPEVVAGRHTFPFIERDGQYWGPPTDDETAIQEVERLRHSGATFMVFGWPAFWWLDHYKGLLEYLGAKYRCILKNKRMVIFDLRS
jgi:nucleoside-diphosphate-sugar epimerase